MAFARSFEGFTPPKRFDGLPFLSVDLLEAATRNGNFAVIDSFSLLPSDIDPTKPQSRSFTTGNATLADGWYVIRWVDGAGAWFDSDPVEYLTTVPINNFASIEDVALRLGRDLTDSEESSVELLLNLASAAIRSAVDKPDDWMPDPVPDLVRGFTIELTCRAMANPEGLFSKSETIGSYSYTNSFSKDRPSGLSLTDDEVLALRRAVWKSNSGSARADSIATGLPEELDDHEGS